MTRAIRKMMAKGLVSRNQFEQAAMLKANSGETLSFHLIQIGALTDEEVVEFMLQYYNAPYYPGARLKDVVEDVISLVPKELALKLRLLPIEAGARTLTLGLTDPTRNHAIEEVAYHTGLEISVVLLTETDMSYALMKHYGESIEPNRSAATITDPNSRTDVPRRPHSIQNDAIHTSSWDRSSKPTVAVRPAVNVTSESILSAPALPATETMEDEEERILSEGEILLEINRADNRDLVIQYSLQYLLQFADRAAFFVVRKGAIRGYEINGVDTSHSAIRSYWAPLLAESTLRQVIRERRIHLGPLGRTAADAILSASLGGRPSRILAIPIEIDHRVVGLLYADRLHVTMPPWNRMERLAGIVGDNLRRIVLKKSNTSA